MAKNETKTPVKATGSGKKTGAGKVETGAKKPIIPAEKNTGRRKGHSAQFSRRLSLNTVPDTRKTWSRLIRLYDRNQLSSAKARDLNSFVRTHLSLLLAERDEDLSKRMDELEERLSSIAIASKKNKVSRKK